MLERFIRRRNSRRDPNPFAPSFANSYLESLAAEKAGSLAELQNATTWGLTIITTGALFILGRSNFPDFFSLLGLLALIVLGTHFTTRAAKGYINVARWSLIQRTLLTALADGRGDFADFEHALRTYHLSWALPLRRRDIAWKSLVELGFGYIFIGLIGSIIYCMTALRPAAVNYIALVAAALFSSFDVYVFMRSPYMRQRVPHPNARRLR
ncbi:hypothetical protein GCM10022225_27140 [Plantactinospora mayteni]|uniref:Uncharacterized protein n=1 Tax=Plantactinospora mayteni TaxID=566021 RepID=A0ABQ4EII9_9ACTN|nr:hypothetical protein [Plantactinospora mayteni]GIG94556.1 hypothetical protein Pma05_11290 [Plantactinospora mayteni]